MHGRVNGRAFFVRTCRPKPPFGPNRLTVSLEPLDASTNLSDSSPRLTARSDTFWRGAWNAQSSWSATWVSIQFSITPAGWRDIRTRGGFCLLDSSETLKESSDRVRGRDALTAVV